MSQPNDSLQLKKKGPPSSSVSDISDISDTANDLSLGSKDSTADGLPSIPLGGSAAITLPSRSLHASALVNAHQQNENVAPGSQRPPSPTPSTLSNSSHIATFGSPAVGSTPRSTTPTPTSGPTNAAARSAPAPVSTNSSASSTPTIPSGRRKSILLNVQNYEPNMPAPGEVAKSPATSRRPSFGGGVWNGSGSGVGSPVQKGFPPSHNRQPSLGDIHQELEVEQEAQVNRLLHMIRQQQIELNSRQSNGTAVAEEESAIGNSPTISASVPRTSRPPSFNHGLPPSLHPRASFDVNQRRRSSRTPSMDVDPHLGVRGSVFGASPRMRTSSMSADSEGGVTRDESAYYQAETQIITRENQMLKHRIRELEKQIAEANGSPISPHDPTRHSSLAHSRSAVDDEDESKQASAA